MKLVDTHCHLDFDKYDADLDAVIERAVSAGVERIVVPGTDTASTKKVSEIAGKYPSVFFAAGIHPHEADRYTAADMDTLRHIVLDADKVVAIGEIGLDHYKGYSDPAAQERLFDDCLKLAMETDLPVILHNREAGKPFIDTLKDPRLKGLRGVVHCFSGDAALLKEVLDLGLHVSFTGSITFDKAVSLKALARLVPIERLLLETDGPFLTPAPHRGKRNEPAYVRYLLDAYSDIYGLSRDDTARITTHNADRLFRLGIEPGGETVYAIRDSIYINTTYRCTNKCGFCARNTSNYVKGYNLKLANDPSTDEVIDALGDISSYREVVFCGFGEPTLRLGMVKRVAGHVKEKGGRVRVITNGQGSLISGRPIAAELKGLVDGVSVSVNAPRSSDYDAICGSVFGERAHAAILEFIKDCVAIDIEVEVTCLDIIEEDAVAEVKDLAEKAGARFRLRHLGVVG